MNTLQIDVMIGKLLSEAEQLWLAFERNQQSRETAKKLRAKLDEVVRLKNANKSHPYLPLLLHQWPNWEFWREQANARLSTPSAESLYELSTQRFANLPLAEALSELQNMFAANPGHPDLTQFALDKSDEFLRNGQPDLAGEVLRVAVHHVGSSPHFADLHRKLEISEAWLRAQATLPVGDWQSARESMEVLSRAQEGIRLQVEREISKHYDHAYDLGQVQAARKLYELELVLNPVARSRERELRDLEKRISNAEVIARLQATLQTIPPQTYDYGWLVKLGSILVNRPAGILVQANPELSARLNGWLREACDRFLRAKGQGHRKEALEQVDEVMRLYEVTRRLEQATGAVPANSVLEAPSQAILGLAAVKTVEQLRAWLDGHTLEQARSELVVETWNEELTQHKHEEELLQEQLQSEQKTRATLEGQLQQKENQFTERVNNLAADLTSLRQFVLPDSVPPAGKPQNLNQVVVEAIRCEVVANLLPETQKAAKSAIADAAKDIAPRIEETARTAVQDAIRDIPSPVPQPSVALNSAEVVAFLAPQLEAATRNAVENALKDIRVPARGPRSWTWQLATALGAISTVLFLALWSSGVPFPFAQSSTATATRIGLATPTGGPDLTPNATLAAIQAAQTSIATAKAMVQITQTQVATTLTAVQATQTSLAATQTQMAATLTAVQAMQTSLAATQTAIAATPTVMETGTSTITATFTPAVTTTTGVQPLTEVQGAVPVSGLTDSVGVYTTLDGALHEQGTQSGILIHFGAFAITGRNADGTAFHIRQEGGNLAGWVMAKYVKLPSTINPMLIQVLQ